MRYFFFISGFAVLFLFSAPGGQAQDIVAEPICFQLVNKAPYRVFGTFVTERFTRPDGIETRHRSSFRLEEPGTIHEEEGYPLDRAEFCSYGPFFPGRKLDLTLRTLVPIFSCRTRIDQGPIVIHGRKKPEGGTETWAACYE